VNAVKPEDVLPDGENVLTIEGVQVRAGSIAAVMRNIELLESGSPDQRKAALAEIERLAPGMVVLGVHRHFRFRNDEVEKIIADAAARHAAKQP